MEQLVELLKQIQDLAGVAIEALQEATGGGAEGPAAPPEGAPPAEEGASGAPEAPSAQRPWPPATWPS